MQRKHFECKIMVDEKKICYQQRKQAFAKHLSTTDSFNWYVYVLKIWETKIAGFVKMFHRSLTLS